MLPAHQLLSLPALQKLHRAGYSPIVLREIEDDLVMQAVETRMIEGHLFDTRDDLLSVAGGLIPQGDRLLALYSETARGMGESSAEDLAMISEHIEQATYALESVAAKAQAQLDSNTIQGERRHQVTRAIGLRLADLMDAAEQVKSKGGPPSIFNLNVVSADERPDGPLGAFYEVAVADLRARGKPAMNTDSRERMRA